MKQKNHGFLIFSLFVFLVLSTSSSWARVLDQSRASLTATATDDLANLMGSEKCDEKDEECLQRRMIAEAHLDYIYTQNHKP